MVWHTMASGHTGSWLQGGERSGTLGLSLGLASPSETHFASPTKGRDPTTTTVCQGTRARREHPSWQRPAGSRSHLHRAGLAAHKGADVASCLEALSVDGELGSSCLGAPLGTQAQQDRVLGNKASQGRHSHLAWHFLTLAPVPKALCPTAMPHQGVLWSPPCVALSSAPALSPKMPSPPRGPLHHLLGGAVCAKGFLALERAPGRRTGGLRLAPGGISALLHPCALLTLPPRPPAHPTLSGQNDPSDHMASFLDKRQLFLLPSGQVGSAHPDVSSLLPLLATIPLCGHTSWAGTDLVGEVLG